MDCQIRVIFCDEEIKTIYPFGDVVWRATYTSARESYTIFDGGFDKPLSVARSATCRCEYSASAGCEVARPKLLCVGKYSGVAPSRGEPRKVGD